ncbi:uncharacterized protein LOC103711279 [Phoenix dactylifera]|uniref:Uncharacterized protein LOC103711279 n=1 Tax=Phoenix dactylifera TaxID=42345 RepID=A0A8B7CB95_PHODC|nr:uncharacterized protein LOC103711279 [Phoenix dactylifera]
MDDFARAYRASGGNYDDRRTDFRSSSGADYDRGQRSYFHPDGGGAYDHGHRGDLHPCDQGAGNELVLYAGGARASDYDRGYRNEFRSIGGGSGNRRLEIVRGNVFSANQTYVTRPPPSRSTDLSMPLPPSCRNGAAVRPYSSLSSSGGGSGARCFGDPEMKRRRRVASYKMYSVEGKVKQSIRKSFRWIKGKCSEMVHG